MSYSTAECQFIVFCSTVESHVQGNRELNERNHCLEKEVDDGKERERRVREQLEEMEQHTEILKHKLNMRSEDWEETIQDVEDKLALLQKEKRKLEDKCSSLQEERDQQSVYRSKLEASLQTERDSFQEKLSMCGYSYTFYMYGHTIY